MSIAKTTTNNNNFFTTNITNHSIHDQELYIEKACKVNLDLSSGICDNLANHTDIKIEVQKEVAGIQVAPIALGL